MNSTMKTALPIGLVVLMVFGITFMSQFTADAPPAVQTAEVDTTLPLVVGSADVMFDPSPAAPPHYRFFPGYYEVGTDGSDNRVGFVIRNPRASSVFLTARMPSCSTCTSARAAAIPAGALRNYFQHVAVGALWSPFPAGDLLSGIAWAQTRPKFAWHEFAFNDSSNRFELPGATDDGESWGLLELGFKMAAAGTPTAKQAAFDVFDSRGNRLAPDPYPFTVMVGGREAQEVNITDYALQSLTEANPEHAFEILCVSVTRDRLPPPTLSVGDGDPHVAVSKPIPMGEEELMSASRVASLQTQAGGVNALVKFRSGYRIQGTVRREAGGRTMDMGPYEKFLFVAAGPGIVIQKAARVRIHGEVVGAIRLEGTNKIDFGTYDGNFLQKKEIRVWTDRKGLELEVVANLCDPSFLKPTLAKPTSEADRTYWTLNVQIPAKEGKRPPWEGFVYLRSKGEKPLNIRIQVSGHGR